MIENRAAVAGDVKIRVAVIVVVSDGDALAIMPGASDAGLFCDVGKRAVAVVAIKRGTKRMRRLVDIRGRGLHEEKIHQAVLVIVDPTDAGAHGFKIIFLIGLRGILEKGDSRVLSNVGEADGNRSVLRFVSLSGDNFLMEKDSGERAQGQDCAANAFEEPPRACLRFLAHSQLISTVLVSSVVRQLRLQNVRIMKRFWHSSPGNAGVQP